MTDDIASGPDRVKVLLVDDDERNLLALTEVLTPIAEVVSARSGREALRFLLADDFAVILLDVFMPEMDGYETATLIRARNQTARIPIIFLSAVNKEVEHLNRGYAMGAVDYVFKPVDPVTLRSKVSVFVDLFRLREEVAQRTDAENALREANLVAEIERLKAEGALRSAEARQAALLKALPMVLYELEFGADDKPRRSFVAGDLKRLVGDDAAGLLSGEIDWDERIATSDIALSAEALAQPSHARTYRWRTSTGANRYISELISPLGSGKWAGTLVDVTDRHVLENQLVQAGKMDAIGQLTGGIAHDFNNLLSAILAGISLLQKRMILDEREDAILGKMRHAAEQGVELIRRMMSFARRQELNPVAVDPKLLCDTVGGLVEHALAGQILIEWDCPPLGMSIYADRSQLELSLLNLIINARDAMPEGGAIAVSFAKFGENEAGAGRVRIVVRDTGQGIPPDVLNQITEPFFTTKQEGKGTGLGLAMVAQFVDQSGGTLDISSELGQGTTVSIVLPGHAEDSDGKVVAERTERASAGSLRVLLVDDDNLVRGLVREELIEAGCDVDDCENGPDALARLKANEGAYDLLITDFAMPGMNGLKVIEAARTAYPGLAIVLVTGYADKDLSELTAQAIPIFAKPFKVEELLRSCEIISRPAARIDPVLRIEAN